MLLDAWFWGQMESFRFLIWMRGGKESSLTLWNCFGLHAVSQRRKQPWLRKFHGWTMATEECRLQISLAFNFSWWFSTFCLMTLIYVLVGSSLLQVWYPSPGVNTFKQEDFLQVFKCFLTVYVCVYRGIGSCKRCSSEKWE